MGHRRGWTSLARPRALDNLLVGRYTMPTHAVAQRRRGGVIERLMGVLRLVRLLALPLAAACVLAAARPLHADPLSPIPLSIEKRVLRLPTPAVRAVDEVYAPLQLLDALGLRYRVTEHEESVVISTPAGKEKEIGLARPGKTAMVPVSAVAALVGLTMRLTERGCLLVKPGSEEPPKPADIKPAEPEKKPAPKAVEQAKPVEPQPKPGEPERKPAAQAAKPSKPAETKARPAEPERKQPSQAVEPPKAAAAKGGATPEACKPAGPVQHAGSLEGPQIAAATPAGASGQQAARPSLAVTRAPRAPLPGVDPDLLCPARQPAKLQWIDFAAPDLAHAQFRLYLDRGVSPKISYLTGPSRLSIEIPGAVQDGAADCAVAHPFAKGITVACGSTADSLQVTIPLGRLVAYSLTESGPGAYSVNLRLPRGAGIKPSEAVVVIDPGHGGGQTGCQYQASGQCIQEKSLTLAIAKQVQAELKSSGVGHTYLTRSDDTQVDLYDRTKIADSHNADLFVSIHIDEWSKSTAACGATAYYHRADESSRALAQSLIGHVGRASVSPSRGALSDGVLYANGLAVLRSATMPAALVECGYITNPNDRKALLTEAYRGKIAKAIASGICSYLSASLPDEPVAALPIE